MSYNCAEDVKPQEGKQTELFQMIANQEADFFMIGGSRFGGKSEVISMVDLLFAGDSKYRSIKFRRSYDEIMGANGLWEKAENQYVHFGATPNKSDKCWTFPSGARSFYRHMFHEGDEESHRGKGYSAVIFDEINQFTWDQVKMLQTCLRSEAEMNSFMIGTLNPDSESWCMKFVEWYLDPATGFPCKEKCGKVRYYLIVEGEPVFAEDPSYFEEHYYDLVHPIVDFDTEERLYVPPKRFTFFFFNIFNNKIGMKMNPQYITELNSLPQHERDTQLFGNWFAKPEGSNMFLRKWLHGLDPKFPSELPLNSVSVRAWDRAWSEVSEKNRYPDFTASIKMYKDDKGEYYIAGDFKENLVDKFKQGEDIIYGRFRRLVGDCDKWMIEQAHHDGLETKVVIPQEGSAGKGVFEQTRRMMLDEGFRCEGISTGNTSGAKAKRFSCFTSLAQQGLIHILPNTFPNKATLEAFLRELENFDPEKGSTGLRKDDWVDAVSDAFSALQGIKSYNIENLAGAFSGRGHQTANQTLLSQQRTKTGQSFDAASMHKYRSQLGASKGNMRNPWG